MKHMFPLLIMFIVAWSTTAYDAPSSLASRSSLLAEQSALAATRLGTVSTTAAQTRVPKRFKILLVQGANLSYLGRREPELYGTTSAAELDSTLRA
jgi:Dehydroquinase class II